MPFVKLDSDILDSTLWGDDDGLKVFLAALCMARPYELEGPEEAIQLGGFDGVGFAVPAGWYGMVRASAQAIVDRAKLRSDGVADRSTAGMAALRRLLEPDGDSRSSEYQGRRLARVNGGFIVLNYMKYRDFDYGSKERMRRFRERKRTETPRDAKVARRKRHVTSQVTDSREQRAESRDVPIPVETTSTVGERIAAPTAPPIDTEPVWSKDACELWKARFGGTVPGGKIGKALKPLVGEHGWPNVRPAWVEYLGSTEAQYASPARFAETFRDWRRDGAVAPPPEAPAGPSGHPTVDLEPEKPAPVQIPDDTPEGVALWGAICERLQRVVAGHNYGTWIRPIRGVRIEEGADPDNGKPTRILVIAVPNQTWVPHLRATGYVERMRIAAEDLGHAGLRFRAMVDPGDPPALHSGGL